MHTFFSGTGDSAGSGGEADALPVVRAIMENAADAIFVMDEAGRATFANRAAERMFGYTAEELKQQRLHDLVHYQRPDGTPFPMEDCPLGAVLSTGGALSSHEDVFFHKDGTPVPVACSNASTGHGGRASAVLIVRDISERRRAEAALRQSHERLRAITNSIDQMIWSTLPDGYHDYYNQRWYDFTGMVEGSTDGEAWAGMFHPDDRDHAWALWRRSLDTGQPYHIEYRLRHHSGEYRWVLGRAQPVRDNDGRIIRWYGTCTDIHDLKQAEEDLRRATALLRLIGDSTPDLIYAKDRDSRMLYANKAAQETIGLADDLLLGRSDAEWAREAREAEIILEHDRRVVEQGEMIDVDETYTDARGRTRHFRSVKSPLRDEAGAIVGLVGISSDVTHRRAAEERERLLAREVDHRAKNVLAVVQSVVQLTRADDIRGFTAAVSGRIQSLARAHSLLAASRWEGADLRQLIVEELAPYAGRDTSRVAAEGPAVRLRPEAAQALALVVHELATNAAKYGSLSTAGGELDVRWAIEGVGADGRLTLGWAERGGPPAAPPTRSGFGSTLMRASVERQLKGEVALDWRPEGLVCRLAIPGEQIAGLAAPAEESEAAHGPAAARGRGGDGVSILVLEDEALIAMQIEEDLRAMGCTVIGPATRVSEAFDLIYATAPDAALLDINVAGERSYAIADILRARGIPFAFVTGFEPASTLPPHLRDAPILPKPFESSAIARLVGRLLPAG